MMLDLWLLLKWTLKHLNSIVRTSLSADLDRDGRAPIARLHGVTTRTGHMEAYYAQCQLNLTVIVLKRESSILSLLFFFFFSCVFGSQVI